jgi:tetratricopeptide (TPR) repeat protein
MAIVAVVIWQSQQTPAALGERDTVVLADFRNRTGDTMFDDTLNEALGVQLRQSPFLNLLPEQQVQETLRLMGRGPMEPLTPEVASEICQRNQGKAMLGGTVSGIGNRYLLTLSAQECATGNIIAEEAVEAENKDAVLSQLGRAAAAFREKLGESLASIERYDQNIEQATTKSLEALKAYSQGMVTRRKQGDAESVAFFRRAIELDPEFALAHARLGTVYSNQGQTEDAAVHTRRAYELREKASERERLYIIARYHTTIDNDQGKAIEAYRLLLATYPDDYAANSNIGTLYRNTGRMSDALRHLEEAVRIAPMQPLGHLNLGGAYLDEARLDEARREFEEVLKLQDHVGARMMLARVAAYQGDDAAAERYISGVKPPRSESDVAVTRLEIAMYRGRMQEAARLTEDVIRLASDQKRLSQAAERIMSIAIAQAGVGNVDEGRTVRDRLLKADAISDGAADEMVGFSALTGDRQGVAQYLDRAVNHLKSVSRQEDHGSVERGMRALAAYGSGRYQEAYDLAIADGVDYGQRTSIFLAGLSALQLQRWDDAARMFETWVKFGPRVGLTSHQALARILLARAHAGANRASDARRAYEEAFAIWKNADADLPVLQQARQEYQRLAS